MKILYKAALLAMLIFYHLNLAAGSAIPLKVCFTPKGNCTSEIIRLINNAKKSIYVQAYSFTSMPIAKALVKAEESGIRVRVILDKSQMKSRYSVAQYLQKNNIPIWIDYKPAIAHNKIMIFDREAVETGSFNYTKSAEYRNAENMLIIYDKILAKKYMDNWNWRVSNSKKLAVLDK